ncbi:MAG: MFS transporter [Pseudolabrys sp.]
MNTATARTLSTRQLAVGIVGYCCFISLYSPQSILPLLSHDFHASAASVSTVITVSTMAVALTAPFTGTVADVLGRKRVIVTAMFLLAIPTIMVGLSPNLTWMITWRGIQGLVLPSIFAVTVAYIGDEWPHSEAATAAGIYSSGSSFGGFSGRLVTGFFADWLGWRYGFFALACVVLTGAVAVTLLLPRERKFVRSEGLLASGKQMLRHVRNPQLLFVYAVGFGVLFNFIATFTFVSFHLAAPPYNLSPTWLGVLFVTYLAGSALTPWTGWAVNRFGRRRFMMAVIATWISGAALMLASPLPVIVLGLTLCAACGLLCQAVSTASVTITAKAGRSSAVGLYVTSFYGGGSFGAALGGLGWTFGNWPACVAMVMGMLLIMGAIVRFGWTPGMPIASAAEATQG